MVRDSRCGKVCKLAGSTVGRIRCGQSLDTGARADHYAPGPSSRRGAPRSSMPSSCFRREIQILSLRGRRRIWGVYADGNLVRRRRRLPWPPSSCYASHLAFPFVPTAAFGRCVPQYWTMKRYSRCLVRLVVGMDMPCQAAGSLGGQGLAGSLPAMLIRGAQTAF